LTSQRQTTWLLGGAALVATILSACILIVDTDPLNEGCESGFKACDGECVSKSDPEYGCGSKTCQPCVLPDATSICDSDGECAVAACVGRHEDCNRNSEDGCEVNLDTDVDHCGACDAPACEVAGAIPACARGECAIRKCRDGFKDCNRDSQDGCEVNVREDPNNCGACATVCADAGACQDGGCSND
jgi:hypothetical protein